MAVTQVLLACLVALAGPIRPPSSQSRPPDTRPQAAARAETVLVGPDVTSLERVSMALQRRGTSIFPLGLPPFPAPPPVVPITPEPVATFRVEIVGPKFPTFEEELKDYLAKPSPSSLTAGFFDLYAGEHRAGAGPGLGVSGGGSAYVHPSALVDWLPRWSRRRAEAKARQQVEAELQALLAAQQKAAEKPEKEKKQN